MKPLRAWVGLVLLTIGVLLLLDASGVVNASDAIERWWPLGIVGLGIIAMLSQGTVSLGPVVITAFGVVLLVNQQDWVEGDIAGPTILVLIGAAILVGIRRHAVAVQPSPVAVFGGTSVQDRSEHLTHQDVSAIFGGATLDLRSAHIEDMATVDAFALFGGVEVLVPRDWRIRIGGLPLFGGYEDKTATGNGELPPDAPTLKVNATAIFGGVKVANEPS